MLNNVTVKREGTAFIFTISGLTKNNKTRIRVDSNGSMCDLSGAAIIQSDVTIVVQHFRRAGNPTMADKVLKWWGKG